MFAVSTRKFGQYQLTKALPYFIKRWVLFQRHAELEPLYQFDQPDRETSGGVQTENNGDVSGTEKKTESE